MSPGEVPTWAEAMSAYANGASTVSNIITAVVTGIAAYVLIALLMHGVTCCGTNALTNV